MHESVMEFVRKALYPEIVTGKRVLEVGSRNINGSPREIIGAFGPEEYVGVDPTDGLDVDVVLGAEALIEHFGAERFDLVVSTKALEHIEHWKCAVHNMKTVCAPGGILMVTTRSPGFKLHDYPQDFWRFRAVDFGGIFSDCYIETLQADPQAPGVFIKAIKPAVNFVECDLSQIRVAAMRRKI